MTYPQLQVVIIESTQVHVEVQVCTQSQITKYIYTCGKKLHKHCNFSRHYNYCLLLIGIR